MVNFVTSSYKPDLFQPIVWKIINNIPEVVSIVNNINTSVGNTSIKEATNLKGDSSEIVLDLFCGTGTIGLTLAKNLNHFYGYELVPQAVADAHRNAEWNDIRNATNY